MEIPKIEIPQIQIKKIYIPRTRTWEQYPTILDIIDKPKIDYPVVSYPTFKALEYHPDKFIPTDPVNSLSNRNQIYHSRQNINLKSKKIKSFL